MKAIISVFILIILTSACSSLVDKGDKLFETGDYQGAAEFYERALMKDQNNVEAKIGLGQARNKIIDRGLIEVRMLRLSSNMNSATEKLEQILRNQKAWSLQFAGAIASTQAEETRYAKDWLLEEGSQLSSSPFPDKYRQFEQRYSHLINTTRIAEQMIPMSKSAKEYGIKNCKELAGNVYKQRFFLKAFTEKYCVSWQEPVRLTVSSSDDVRYRSVQIKNAVRHSTNYNNSQKVHLTNRLKALNEIFRNSIWYSNIGKKTLRFDVAGNIRYARFFDERQRIANYTINNTVKSKNELGEEIVKTYEQTKNHPYYVQIYLEEYALDVSLSTRIEDKLVTRNVLLNERHETESHSENFPEAGLQPTSPQFLNLTSLLDTKMDYLQNDFLRALNQQWHDTYCGNQLGSQSGENVLRCAKVDTKHAFVNTWFTNKFGINYVEFSALYGLD